MHSSTFQRGDISGITFRNKLLPVSRDSRAKITFFITRYSFALNAFGWSESPLTMTRGRQYALDYKLNNGQWWIMGGDDMDDGQGVRWNSSEM